MLNFILNIVTTVYFGIFFIMSFVIFVSGPMIQKMNETNSLKYGTKEFLIELFGFVFHLFFMNTILSEIGRRYGIPNIPGWFSFIYSIVTLRNIVFNFMFTDTKKFNTHFGIEKIVYWVLVGYGLFVIWN